MNSKGLELNKVTLVDKAEEQKPGVNSPGKQTNNEIDGKSSILSHADTDQSTTEREKNSLSYEAFEGEFHAEKIQIYLPKKNRSRDTSSSDDGSTSDDVSTICDEEITSKEPMPQQVKSRFEDRVGAHHACSQDITESFEPRSRKTWRRPQSAGELKSTFGKHQPTSSTDIRNATHFTKKLHQSATWKESGTNVLGIKETKHNKKINLKRYSSTGDLRTVESQSSFGKKRHLPNVSICKHLAASDIEDGNFSDSTDSETVKYAPTPEDRKTLEAQFQLLYRENLKLDKAYGDLQEKVRSQSPQILSNRFLSPREIEWQIERKKYKREIDQLNGKISELEALMASQASPTDDTEKYAKEKMQDLQIVKDKEIARLTEQVSYWLRQAYMQSSNLQPASTSTITKLNGDAQERIADLEQSEAFLQCQIINLEDQVTNLNTELSQSKKENEDLGKHCEKLENCVAVIDAEKALLDDLKQQSQELRLKLSESEHREQSLGEKLAQLLEDKVELEKKISLHKEQGNLKLIDEIKKLKEENHHLQITSNSLHDRCAGLENLKECLVQQIESIEEASNAESLKHKEQIKKLNESVRKLKEERESLIEIKDQLELNEELHLNMTDKSNKRIEDLLHHIETLKSQLENQKSKIESFNEVYYQLDMAMLEKGTLEALCSQYKVDIEELQNKITCNQNRLSDSFEQVNKQLMDETDEMATRQQGLMIENQTLRMRSCSRGFDAVIGRKFCENACPLIEACVTALFKAQAILKNTHPDVELFPDRVEWTFNDARNLLSDEDAIKLLDEYGDEIVGTTVAELRQMQDHSPRLSDVTSLSQLIDGVKKTHQAFCALQNIKRSSFALRDYLEEQQTEISDAIKSKGEKPAFRNTPSPTIDGNTSARIIEKSLLQEKVDSLQEELKTTKKILQLVKEENEKVISENQKNCNVNTLQKELDIMQNNEKVLLDKLNQSQQVCDSLVARTRTLQEEKYELIKNCTDAANVKELKEKLSKAECQVESFQNENRLLSDTIKEMQKVFSKTEDELRKEIEVLNRDLDRVTKSENSLRICLDETQKAGDELLKRFQEVKDENEQATNSYQLDLKQLQKDLKEKVQLETRLATELEEQKEKLKSSNSNVKSLEQRLKNANEVNMEIKIKLTQKGVDYEALQNENDELKLKLDFLEQEKEKNSHERNVEIETIKEELYKAEKQVQEQNEKLAERDRSVNESLENELQELQYRLARVTQQREEMASQISDNEKRKNDMSEKNKNHESFIAKLKENIETKVYELQKAEELYLEEKKKFDSLSQNMNELLEKNLKLSTELSDNNETVIALRQQINRLERRALVNTSPQNGNDQAEKGPVSQPDNSTVAESTDHRNTHEPASTYELCDSEVMSSELEHLRLKCLNLEHELSALKSEKQLIELAVDESRNEVASRQNYNKMDVERQKNKRRLRKLSSKGEISSSSHSLECCTSTSAEESEIETDKGHINLADHLKSSNENVPDDYRSKSQLYKENKLLQEKIEELENILQDRDNSQNESWLYQENHRLLDLLKEAEKEVEDNQMERQKLEMLVNSMQSKLSENEACNQQSGTESEPEAIYYERKRKEEIETRKKIENLKLQLEETECLVVAHKNKLSYVESLNEDLHLANTKLKSKLTELESRTKFHMHPVVEKIYEEIRERKLSQSAPAILEQDESVTPRGSWAENETIPLDHVMKVLCEKVTQSQSTAEEKELENQKLQIAITQMNEKLQSTFERNGFLEKQSLDYSNQLEKSQQELNGCQSEIMELEELLMRNKTTAKERLQSKEEDIDKLQEQLMSLSAELQGKNSLVTEMKRIEEEQTENFERELCNLKNRVITTSQDLKDKTNESVDLMDKTRLLSSQNEVMQAEVAKKETEIEKLKINIEQLEQENTENAERARLSALANQHLTVKLNSTMKMHDETIEHLKTEICSLEESSNQLKDAMANKDQSIANLNLELTGREEQIEVLSARVGELIETEEALKKTMNSADDMIAAREREHLDEVLQLKDGLNRTLSEAQRAEMTSEELIQEISELEKTNKGLLDEIEGMKEKENNVDHQIEAIEIEKALLNTSLESEREERGELIERIKLLNEENKELSVLIESLHSTINKLQEQMAQLQNESDSHAHETKVKDIEISELTDEVSRLQVLLQNSSQLKRNGNKTDCEIGNKDYASLVMELDQVREENSALSDTLAKLNFEKDQLGKEVRRLHLDYPLMSSPIQSERKDESEQTNPSEFVSDISMRSINDENYNELVMEQVLNSRLQEESSSLRSENEALRSKIASLEGSISAMTERLVPRLELGSIADESEPKRDLNHDDDTGRYVAEIDTTRETGIGKVEILEEKLRMSEEAGTKLLIQVQELEEEAEMLRSNLQKLSGSNSILQNDSFSVKSDSSQTDDHTSEGTLDYKDEEISRLKNELAQISLKEEQWHNRYEEVQSSAEELHQRLQKAEVDNHELQRKLMDLDMECRSILVQNQDSRLAEMKQETLDAVVQTLTVRELLQEIKQERKAKAELQNGDAASNKYEDTDDDIADLTSSASEKEITVACLNPLGSATQITNLADDQLLQETILKVQKESEEESFSPDDIPEPITDSIVELSQIEGEQSTSNHTVKSLQNELVGYQLMIGKLKQRNQELLEGSGAAMSQDHKEALEREISALRGQVALLERNNRIFSDRERNELKQDLELANKRCNSLQSQLHTLKSSLEYGEMETMKKRLQESIKEAAELREKIKNFETSESDDGSSSVGSTIRQNKYARLLELEEEAEELKNKLEEKDEDLKDRDVMIEELRHRMSNVKRQYEQEIEDLEKKNNRKVKQLEEEIAELQRDVAEKKDIIELKQNILRNKTDRLDSGEMEIEKLEEEVHKKNKLIQQLKWEIESLQKENFQLRERIDRLKHALSSSSDSVLIEAGMSPVGTYYSPVAGSPPSRIRSRTSTPRSSYYEPEGKSYRSSDSIGHSSPDVSPHRSSSRPRRAYSFEIEDDSPTSALREGIHEAKEAVHQMGDVLDTPRMTPRRRSPAPSGDYASKTNLKFPTTPTDANSFKDKVSPNQSSKKRGRLLKDESKRKLRSDDADTDDNDSTSMSSFSSLDNKNNEKDLLKEGLHKNIDEPAQLTILSVPSDSNAQTMEETGTYEVSKGLESLDGPVPNENGTKSKTSQHVVDKTHPLVEEFSVSATNVDLSEEQILINELLGVPVSHSTTAERGVSVDYNPSKNLISFPGVTQPDNFTAKTTELLSNKLPDGGQSNDSSLYPEVNSERTQISGNKSFENPNDADKNQQSRNNDSSFNVSLLPDDRPTLIQEVAKAREEARKWFTEVTESDRERRELSRRLKELENELARLKNVENNYELMKNQQDSAKRVSDELEQVRAQFELANRKAEEAREKNAILRAHLLDKEAENENAIRKNASEKKRPRNKHHKDPNTFLPLSELQEHMTSPVSAKPSLPKLSPEHKKMPTENQLREIQKSFEYIAANFADLILKKHDSETPASPEQRKVSKLKRKCLERDQLLAKLVLKLRKRKDDQENDSHDDSLTSSTGFESILTQADRMMRSDVIDSDSSAIGDDVVSKKGTPADSLSHHYSPISSLMKSLSSKSPKSPRTSPTHRIYVAKHDYTPSQSSLHASDHLPVTHSLLPDLPLFSGDTVVAIGNPDEREDGKLYQMAEVHGKIGFVPLSNLVAAEQVEGMQAFVQERGKGDRSKSISSSSDKIVDLYKKLEQAQALVADKIDRNTKSKHSRPKREKTKAEKREKLPFPASQSTPRDYVTSQSSTARTKEETSDDISVTSETSTVKSFNAYPTKIKPKPNKKLNGSFREAGNRSFDSGAEIPSSLVSHNVSSDVIRTSTPVPRQHSHNYRSSSLPPRRDSSSRSSKSGYSTPGHFVSSKSPRDHRPRRGRSCSSSRSKSEHPPSDSSFRSISPSRDLPVMSQPDPPTFLVIEKTMGQKSMIICWTPPLLDMISRSNNIPVIGYEISVDKIRKVQISGAYTNKAILGDLDLTKQLQIEVKTVSSVGSLSAPCEVVFTPNLQTSSSTGKAASSGKKSSPKTKHQSKTPERSRSKKAHQHVTALYNYDPPVDSPYKSHDKEVPLRQGDNVIILDSPRPDGFCDVQVDGKRGFAPIAFLISSCDETIASSEDNMKMNSKKKLTNKKKTNPIPMCSSPNSSFCN